LSVSRSPYDILGVSKNASIDEIKSQYRRLALRFHPDKNKSKYSEADFKEITKAYEILCDPIKRESYDKESNSNNHEKKSQQTESTLQVWKRQLKTIGKEILRLIQKHAQKMQTSSSQKSQKSGIFEFLSGSSDLLKRESNYQDHFSNWLGTSNFVGENPNPRRKRKTKQRDYEEPWERAFEEDSRLANEIFGVEKPRSKKSQRNSDYGFNMEDVFDL